MNKLANYFLKGLLVCIPLVVTSAIMIWVFQLLYSVAKPFVPVEQPPFWMRAALTGGVLVLMLLAIVLAGVAASNYIGAKAIHWIDTALGRLPMFSMIYSSVKDITQALGGEKKKFDKPVLIQFTPGGPMTVGFVTAESMDFAGVAERVAVYMPQSYNFAGQMLIVPKEWIVPLNLDSTDAMTLVVSGGIVKPRMDAHL